MADNYPTIDQSPKSDWAPLSQQVNVYGPNNKPYVANDGRNYTVLHYNVKLRHDLIDDTTRLQIEDHYKANRRFRFLLVNVADGITYNCMYKSPPDQLKDENNWWNVTSFFIASSTTLT